MLQKETLHLNNKEKSTSSNQALIIIIILQPLAELLMYDQQKCFSSKTFPPDRPEEKRSKAFVLFVGLLLQSGMILDFKAEEFLHLYALCLFSVFYLIGLFSF